MSDIGNEQRISSTFADFGSGCNLNVPALISMTEDLCDFPTNSDFRYRVNDKHELTEEQYLAIGRCPPEYKPLSLKYQERVSVVEMLSEGLLNYNHKTRVIPQTDLSEYGVTQLEDTLEKDAPNLLSYTRIRVGKLILALSRGGHWSPRCDAVIEAALHCSWRKSKTANILLAVACGPEDGVRELTHFLELGGYGLSDIGFVKAAKAHHEMLRSSRINLFGKQISTMELSECVYISCLVGRVDFRFSDDLLKEIRTRANPPIGYTNILNPEISFDDHLEEMVTGRMKFALDRYQLNTHDAYNRAMFRNVANGSSSTSRTIMERDTDKGTEKYIKLFDVNKSSKVLLGEVAEVVGNESLGSCRLMGSKRFVAEVTDHNLIDSYKEDMTVYPFYKWEPAKVRWIYPASFAANKLGQYITSSGERVFYGLNGIDLGNDLAQTIATKLDVIRATIDPNLCAINADGTNFNAGHTNESQHRVMLAFINGQSDSSSDALEDARKAVQKYKLIKENTTIVFSRAAARGPWDGEPVEESEFMKFSVEKNGLDDETMIVIHSEGTLLSGENVTQLQNTAHMMVFSYSAGIRLARESANARTYTFCKGDDMNGFTDHWLASVVLALLVEKQGVELGRGKDFCDYWACDHERCVVNGIGYNGSVFRKIGHSIPSEPQGSSLLTLPEIIQWAVECGRSLACRGACAGVVDVIIEAALMTYFNKFTVPEALMRSLYAAKCNGGFGVFLDNETTFRIFQSGQMNTIDVRFRLKDDGPFNVFGSATMTDSIITDLMERFPHQAEKIRRQRVRFLSASLKSAMGSSAYGGGSVDDITRAVEDAEHLHEDDMNTLVRAEALATVSRKRQRENGTLEEGEELPDNNEDREGFLRIAATVETDAPVIRGRNRMADNVADIVRFVSASLCHTRTARRILSPALREVVAKWSCEFGELLKNPQVLRVYSLVTPESALLESIARLGLVDMEMAGIVLEIPGKLSLRRHLLGTLAGNGYDRMLRKLSGMKHELQVRLYDGKIDGVFLMRGEHLSPDVQALVRTFALHKMTNEPEKMQFQGQRQLKEIVHFSHMLSHVSRLIYKENKVVLGSLSY